MVTPEEMKARQRVVWAAGDYPDLAQTVAEASDVVVEAAAVTADDAVLDVATGTGNAALVAARLGARVTATDFTTPLLEVARERAAAEGLDIAFLDGDAEELPVEDDAFDRVISVFGAIFAADHARAAAELLRACRPGGTIALSAWTPEGLNGAVFGVVSRHLPPPPGVQPPTLWGTEEHVRALFADAAEVRCERHFIDVVGASPEAWTDYLTRVLGPLVLAQAALEASGGWEPLRADLIDLFAEANEADDGSLRAPAEYLVAIVTR
jgi:ubiquinone/menaquinone biosynthesis C-methylase UbiE